MKPQKLHGVFVALVTPMDRKEEIDFLALQRQVRHLLQQGVHGLIPLGSTGEFYALSAKERRDVAKATLEAVDGQVPVLVGTNAGSTREVIALSLEAQDLGAAGVMLAAPYYSRPSLTELSRHFRAVNDALDIPIMLYNYPGRTGVDMTPEFLERLCDLPRIRYVKESTGEIARVSTLIRRCGDRLGVFCGADTAALESLVLGAVGWVGGVANVTPESHVRLYELIVSEKDLDQARKLYFRMLPLLNLMEGGGHYTQWVKGACALVGRPAGPPRQPLRTASASDLKLLRDALACLPVGSRSTGNPRRSLACHPE